jgi:UDP-N-acetylmuramyl tripeptide synthase
MVVIMQMNIFQVIKKHVMVIQIMTENALKSLLNISSSVMRQGSSVGVMFGCGPD